jgi:hypothetical protein
MIAVLIVTGGMPFCEGSTMHRMRTRDARWWLLDNSTIVSFDYALSITGRRTK